MLHKYHIGCSGWSYKDWVNVFYPDKLSSREYLRYYALFFDTVEINNTFYNFPTEKSVQAWALQVPKGFKFSLKANRSITHVKHFKNIQEPLKRLYGLSNILEEKTGCFLFQFPKSVIFSFETLDNILSQIDNRHYNVFEFRHEGWWNSEVIQAFQNSNIGFCSVSGFNLPEDLVVINKKAYLRLHGNPPYSSLYSCQDLHGWLEKIECLSEQCL